MYYYHVRITRKSEPSHDIVVLDLGQDQLRKRVLQPYENGNPIVIRGTTILLDDLKQIRITRTQDDSSKILPIVRAERAQSRVVVSISDDWFVADKGEDVTDGFITGLPGLGAHAGRVSYGYKTEDLSIESLNKFAGNYQDIAVAGEVLPPIEVPFQIRAREFLEFAVQDLRENEPDRYVVNALSNTKRAIECQVDTLLVAFGLFSLSKNQGWNFPRKKDTLRRLGVVAPDILKRITEKRNILEHEYVRPNAVEVRDALDVARLFIEATDVFMAREWRDIDVENLITRDAIAVTLDYRQGKMTLSSVVKKVLTAGSDEYLDYLAWFVPVMRKWG